MNTCICSFNRRNIIVSPINVILVEIFLQYNHRKKKFIYLSITQSIATIVTVTIMVNGRAMCYTAPLLRINVKPPFFLKVQLQPLPLESERNNQINNVLSISASYIHTNSILLFELDNETFGSSFDAII